jgi:hypothetical protein
MICTCTSVRSFPWFPPTSPLPCPNHIASSASLSGWFYLQKIVCFLFPQNAYATTPYSGGGVGGLILAFALSRSPNIRVDVYEAASKFAEIGAGIGIWWRAKQVLTSLGLEEDIIRLLPFRPDEDQGEPGRYVVGV